MPRRPVQMLKLDRRVAIRILRDLESLVVSLDRIGSAYADDPEGCDRATLAFVEDWELFRKLAGMRGSLGELFSRRLGPDGMDELEREVQDVPCWSRKRPRPPRSYAERERRFVRRMERRPAARTRRKR